MNTRTFLKQDLLTIHGPSSDFTGIRITPIPTQQDVYQVEVSLSFDSDRSEEEARANAKIGSEGNNIDLCYTVKIPFDALTIQLESAIKNLYNTSIIKRLLDKDALEIESQRQHYDGYIRAMQSIRGIGQHICFLLFEDPRIQYESIPSEHHRIAQNALRKMLARNQLIEIISQRPLFPWAWLYSEPVDKRKGQDSSTYLVGLPSVENFWGMRHQLCNRLNGLAAGTRMSHQDSVKVVGAICPDLFPKSGLSDHLIEFFGARVSALSGSQISIVNNKQALLEILQACEADILYFLGHGSHDTPPLATTSWISLQELRLSAAEVMQLDPPIHFAKSPVLIFINACKSAPLGQFDEQSLAGILSLGATTKGRACCLLAAAPVPRKFAQVFGQEVWQQLLNGFTIGQALHAARKHMWARYQNPLGLVYALLGRLETRLSQ